MYYSSCSNLIARAALLLFIFVMVRTNLNLVQWNARGLGLDNINTNKINPKSKVNCLKKLICDLNYPDVICLQEPLTKPNHKIDFENYNYEVIYKSPGCRGLLTLVKNNHTFKLLHQQNNKYLTSHTLEIHINNQTKMHITNYYRHWGGRNNTQRNTQNLEDLIGNPLKQNLQDHIIMGDFNCHSALWGSNRNCKIGKIITKIIEDGEMLLFNTGESTRIGQKVTETDTSIDLTIGENLENIHVSTWKVLDDELSSDHFPIQLNCGTGLQIILICQIKSIFELT